MMGTIIPVSSKNKNLALQSETQNPKREAIENALIKSSLRGVYLRRTTRQSNEIASLRSQ